MPSPSSILVAALLGAGCATTGSEVHLAPVWSRLSTAGGGVREEALLGAVRIDRPEPGAPPDRTRAIPFYSWRDRGRGRSTTNALPPLGFTTSTPEETVSSFIPLYLYRERPNEAFGSKDFELLIFPGLLMLKRSDGEYSVGQVPLIGMFDSFLTYQDLMFVALPLYLRAERDGRRSTHFLFPVLGWTRGAGESSFRIWPLFSHTRLEGRFDRWYWLWPFLHYQRNHLGGGNEEPGTTWMVWPFLGHERRGTFSAWTMAWPFFGLSRDPRSDFIAVDAPWPFVRFQSGGPDGTLRRRVWPLYGYLRTPTLTSHSALFPLLWHREERYPGSTRVHTTVVPFYTGWRRLDLETGAGSEYRLLWPFFEEQRSLDGRDRLSLPSLWPLGRSTWIEWHLAWAWELGVRELTAAGRSERALWGLWARETDDLEDRRSLAGVWARREYREDDEEIAETSLLFGLLRWRSRAGSGTQWLPPAFPGPGWPLARAAPEPAAPEPEEPDS